MILGMMGASRTSFMCALAAATAACVVVAAACVGEDPDANNNNPTSDGGDGSSTSDGSPDGPTTEDAGTDAADASIGPFTPAKLPGLVSWLTARDGVLTNNSDVVVAWADQAKDASSWVPLSPATAPRLVDAGLPGALPDAAVVAFTNDSLEPAVDPRFNWGTGDFAIFVLANPGSTVTNQYELYYSRDAQNLQFGLVTGTTNKAFVAMEATTQRAAYDGGAQNFHDNTFRVFAARRKASVITLWLDGSSVASGASNLDVTATKAPRLGAGFSTPTGIGGVVAEVVLVAGPMTDDEMKTVTAFLRSSNGL
jgi:hypothetical protein